MHVFLATTDSKWGVTFFFSQNTFGYLLERTCYSSFFFYSQAADGFVHMISGKRPEKFKLIISSHNFQNTPSTEVLGELVARIQAAGADIVKIATTAVDIVDVARMFQVMVHCQVSDLQLYSIEIPWSMGICRLLSTLITKTKI